VKYEDLLVDTLAEFRKIVEFIELDISGSQLENAILHSSADRMRAREIRESPYQATRSDKLFVRSAQSGNWKNTIPERYADRLQNEWRKTMSKLGYL
jgi:hypothetical protein